MQGRCNWGAQGTFNFQKWYFCYFWLLMIFENLITPSIYPGLDTHQKVHTAHITGGVKFGLLQGSIGKYKLVLN